jgi:hypothetical protein
MGSQYMNVMTSKALGSDVWLMGIKPLSKGAKNAFESGKSSARMSALKM